MKRSTERSKSPAATFSQSVTRKTYSKTHSSQPIADTISKISSEKLDAHYKRLCLESSHAIRQMVLPCLKLKATKITSTPVAVAAAGSDYFFEFKTFQRWAKEYGYDFLSFKKAAHNLIGEPDKFDFGNTIYEWLDPKITKK